MWIKRQKKDNACDAFKHVTGYFYPCRVECRENYILKCAQMTFVPFLDGTISRQSTWKC